MKKSSSEFEYLVDNGVWRRFRAALPSLLTLMLVSTACVIEDVDDLDDMESSEDQDDWEDIAPLEQSEPGMPAELTAESNEAQVGGRKCCDGSGAVACIDAAPCGGCDATYHRYVECVAYPNCVNPYCRDGWVEVIPGAWQCNGRRWEDEYPACDGFFASGCDECL